MTAVKPVRSRAGLVVRGGLIGAAEAVPGISGGTVALVTGVYEAVMTSAGNLVSAVAALVTGRRQAARAALRAVQWGVLLPLLAGMVPVLIGALLVLAPAIDRYPVPVRALLFGMVAAALVVPARMVGRWRLREVAAAVAAAAGAFLATGQMSWTVEPALPIVFLVAAVAVCALVLPGVSGAFLLLAFGLYGPTRDAVRELDVGYVAAFGLGAACGLAGFVKGLQWLLDRHRRMTLAVMTGLVAGALRALWPWQGEDRELLAPDDRIGLAIGLVVLGVAAVLAVVAWERRSGRDGQVPPAQEPPAQVPPAQEPPTDGQNSPAQNSPAQSSPAQSSPAPDPPAPDPPSGGGSAAATPVGRPPRPRQTEQ